VKYTYQYKALPSTEQKLELNVGCGLANISITANWGIDLIGGSAIEVLLTLAH
jgi:hypothetical protein